MGATVTSDFVAVGSQECKRLIEGVAIVIVDIAMGHGPIQTSVDHL
jgi:hypothetical protein